MPDRDKWMWAAAAAIVAVFYIANAIGGGSDESTSTTSAAPFVSENLLEDYQAAYGGDVTGTDAVYVTSVRTMSWGLEVKVQSSADDVAEWACGNVKSLLGWERRVEVWSEGGVALTSC